MASHPKCSLFGHHFSVTEWKFSRFPVWQKWLRFCMSSNKDLSLTTSTKVRCCCDPFASQHVDSFGGSSPCWHFKYLVVSARSTHHRSMRSWGLIILCYITHCRGVASSPPWVVCCCVGPPKGVPSVGSGDHSGKNLKSRCKILNSGHFSAGYIVGLHFCSSGKRAGHLGGNSTKSTDVSLLQTTLKAQSVHQSVSKLKSCDNSCNRFTSSTVMVVVLAEAAALRHAHFFGWVFESSEAVVFRDRNFSNWVFRVRARTQKLWPATEQDWDFEAELDCVAVMHSLTFPKSRKVPCWAVELLALSTLAANQNQKKNNVDRYRKDYDVSVCRPTGTVASVWMSQSPRTCTYNQGMIVKLIYHAKRIPDRALVTSLICLHNTVKVRK